MLVAACLGWAILEFGMDSDLWVCVFVAIVTASIYAPVLVSITSTGLTGA